MITAILFTLSSMAGAASAQDVSHPANTIRHLKGQPSIAATNQETPRKAVAAVCHPDSHKGLACRVANAKAREAGRQELAQAGNESIARNEDIR